MCCALLSIPSKSLYYRVWSKQARRTEEETCSGQSKQPHWTTATTNLLRHCVNNVWRIVTNRRMRCLLLLLLFGVTMWTSSKDEQDANTHTRTHRKLLQDSADNLRAKISFAFFRPYFIVIISMYASPASDNKAYISRGYVFLSSTKFVNELKATTWQYTHVFDPSGRMFMCLLVYEQGCGQKQLPYTRNTALYKKQFEIENLLIVATQRIYIHWKNNLIHTGLNLPLQRLKTGQFEYSR